MKISNKPNFVAGAILLLIAAFFSISLALLPLDFGNFGPAQDNLLYITAFSLGDMLFSVYGFSSILIPVFLLISGLSCFASKWTSKKSMRLLTAVVPFFTSVFIEKLCRYFAKDYTDDFSTIKIVLAIIIGVMLVVMEIIIAGLVAERINDMIFHREKFLAEKEQKIAEQISEKQEEFRAAKETENHSEPKTDSENENAEKNAEETVLQNEPEIQPAANEEKSASEPTAVAESEPVVQREDPFANLFDEEEPQNANSMITQEEFAALNGFNDEPENSDFTELVDEQKTENQPENPEPENDFENQEEPADDLEWPDAEEIKAQAGAVEIPVEVQDDEDSAEKKSIQSDNNFEPAEDDFYASDEENFSENTKDSDDSENFENSELDSDNDSDELENSLSDFEKYNDEVEDEQFSEDSYENEPENTDSHETLSPDFFDIDMNSDDEPVPSEDSAGNTEDDENSTISFNSDVFADMENDARKQLEKNENDSFFDEKENSHVPADGTKSLAENFENHEDFSESEETKASAENNISNLETESFVHSFSEDEKPTEPTVEGKIIETSPVPERKTIATEPAPVSHVARPKKPYVVPTDLLEQYEDDQYWLIDAETKESAVKLKKTLSDFGISAEVIGIKKGPVVTMFEIAPAPGVKLSKIVALQDNIALSLAASSVRIVAPIPGKAAVGIEVPNKKRSIVSFREMIEQDLPEFQKMAIPVILGKDILGKSQIIDIAKTPHLLIAGATGAGKSVCVNSIILSILYKRSPQQVKMILVDPKVVELKLYNDIPHLLTPVITEPKKALQGLQWCLCEMERRYALLDQMGVRDISSYNKRIEERKIATEKLPYIVIIIDEFADLMATSGKELESNVARLAAMSRAVGIHLVLATQRPSVNVITGLIKANIPSRIAFMVASRTDSNIIIDAVGAEKLLGKGDMLYASAVSPYPIRIQGTFESDSDVEHVVDYVKTLGEPDYIDDEIFVDDDDDDDGQQNFYGDDADPLYEQALDIVIQSGKASASYIQRRLKVGYNRAARLVEEMEARGIVGPANGSKPREIIHVPS